MTHTLAEITAMIERLEAGTLAHERYSTADDAMVQAAAMLREVAAERDALARDLDDAYRAMKLQAAAVRTLQANEATEINMLREKSRFEHVAVATLDSERAANARLTEELEAAEAERDRLAAMVEKLRGYAVHKPNCSLWSASRFQWAECTCGLSDVLKESENG